jgi:Fe-S cluster assembly ATP-binding protein
VSTLEIRDLHVTVDTENGAQEILRGVDLTVKAGETHAIMGPNGSGKSTLAYSIAGHPKYTVAGGTVTLDGEDVLEMTVDERARAGLFLAMQYPVEVPGVSVSNFLRSAKTAIDGEAPKLRTWVKEVKEAMARLSVDPSFAERSVNEGFSGGEKKRHEILQDPRGAAIAVAISASASFLTPIGYQTNTMVYGPGGYRFSDYVRLGAPLTIVTIATIVWLVPVFWPA